MDQPRLSFSTESKSLLCRILRSRGSMDRSIVRLLWLGSEGCFFDARVQKLSTFILWSSFFIVSFYGRKHDERFVEIVSPVEWITGADTLVLVTVAKLASSNSTTKLSFPLPHILLPGSTTTPLCTYRCYMVYVSTSLRADHRYSSQQASVAFVLLARHTRCHPPA
jgi:hypothetical protein